MKARKSDVQNAMRALCAPRSVLELRSLLIIGRRDRKRPLPNLIHSSQSHDPDVRRSNYADGYHARLVEECNTI